MKKKINIKYKEITFEKQYLYFLFLNSLFL